MVGGGGGHCAISCRGRRLASWVILPVSFAKHCCICSANVGRTGLRDRLEALMRGGLVFVVTGCRDGRGQVLEVRLRLWEVCAQFCGQPVGLGVGEVQV